MDNQCYYITWNQGNWLVFHVNQQWLLVSLAGTTTLNDAALLDFPELVAHLYLKNPASLECHEITNEFINQLSDAGITELSQLVNKAREALHENKYIIMLTMYEQ